MSLAWSYSYHIKQDCLSSCILLPLIQTQIVAVTNENIRGGNKTTSVPSCHRDVIAGGLFLSFLVLGSHVGTKKKINAFFLLLVLVATPPCLKMNPVYTYVPNLIGKCFDCVPLPLITDQFFPHQAMSVLDCALPLSTTSMMTTSCSLYAMLSAKS